MALNQINSPADLSKLSENELCALAAEIRGELCRLIQNRSVHFASNLGVVELTIALHRAFDFSKDRLVWDVGHQIYPHKMLTGRFQQMDSIRTKGGLMGYPNPEESPYDLFMTGHAGVSASTALGLLCGDDLLHPEENRKSVAVVGDGAFGCGTIFEAINHTSYLQKNLIVILNDNKMSICPRVGGLARYLDGIRTHSVYNGVKNEVKRLISGLPVIGKPLHQGLHRLKNAVKKGLLGGMFFEELGFHYIGPIDGHDFRQLQTALQQAKRHTQPVLLHVLTQKGHGFAPAEDDPARYHAPPKVVYDDEGEIHLQRAHQVSYTKVAASMLYQAMLFDPKIVVISAAMTQGNFLEKIRDDFPDRFFDVGICESHAVALAAGLAKSGMKPIVDIYSTFMQRAYDQIFHEVSLQNLPLVLLMDRAGLVGSDGPTHHGTFDIAYTRHFPNLTVLAPGDFLDLQQAITWSLGQNRPITIRYPKDCSYHAPRTKETPYVSGQAEWIKEGADGLILSCGALLEHAVKAVEQVEQKAIQAGKPIQIGIVNARFIKPLDDRIADWVSRSPWTITLEDGCLQGGFGSAVLELLCDRHADARTVKRLGIPDAFIAHATRPEQLDEVGLNAAGIVRAIEEFLAPPIR